MSEARATLGELADVLRRHDLLLGVRGPEDLAVYGVTQDSRETRSGDLFLAWAGTHVDAHQHVRAAAEAGAVAAVVERWIEGVAAQLFVSDGRRAGAILAHELWGRPTDRLFVTAVTGTNGKTTTAYLARQLLAARGPAASIGTLGLIGPDGRVREGTEGLTTPGPVELARHLSVLVEEGVTSVTIEASSHALEQRRLDGISVDVACFTNLTRDHLDYHGDLTSYRDAKARLLQRVREGGGVVVNGDDPAWSGLPPVSARLLITRVISDESAVELSAPGAPRATGERLSELRVQDLTLSGEGSRFRLSWGEESTSVALPLLGRFNVENAVVAAGSALLAGLSLQEVGRALTTVTAPAGRLEVAVEGPVPVIIDYAHTPDALARALETIRPLFSGRVLVVFGAGGDRDRAKRPQMGKIAAAGADLPIVTSDNPRTEDPDAIIDEVVAGMPEDGYLRVTDRREAIARALEEARPGDVVLLAGKGHESYQVIGDEKHPFDERAVLSELLQSGGRES